MTHLCRCQRDLHDHPLSEKVAKFWATHTFPESYDPELDDSPIVCPGSYTEGPLPAQHTHTITSLYDSMWSFIGSLEGSFKIAVEPWISGWMPQQSEYGAVPYKYTTNGQSVVYFAYPKQPQPWVIWTESPIQKAYNAIKKMANTLENLTCEKSDVVIEFGPKNWSVEPVPKWSIWQPWHFDVPPVYSAEWKESIQLPDLPVDYQKVAEEFNEKQVSFPGVPGKYSFSKLIGV